MHSDIVLITIVNGCQYDNRTYGLNHAIITKNCTKMCGCKFIDGIAVPTCKPLCKSQEDPTCNPASQNIQEFEPPLNGTTYTCTRKRCVPGLGLF